MDQVGLGSIEYAVEHLGTHWIVVWGTDTAEQLPPLSGKRRKQEISDVFTGMRQRLRKRKGQCGDPIENAVRANARDIAKHLQNTGPIIAPRVQWGSKDHWRRPAVVRYRAG